MRTSSVAALWCLVVGVVSAQQQGQPPDAAGDLLATVRIPQAVMANGQPLPPGTYDLRLAREQPAPRAGQSADAQRWVEFVAGGAVVGREVAEVVRDSDLPTVGASSVPSGTGAQVDLLKGGDFLRVSVKRNGERYLVHLPVAAERSQAVPPGPPALFSEAWYQQFRGPYSAAAEPFRIVGNIYYVGGANIASYLITTPEGHILIDTGMTEMHDVITRGVAALGFKTSDIRIMLSSHAHFDHVAGHAAMQRLTGAQVMAMAGDAEALAAGKDNSALGAIGWEPVKVARVLADGDTVSLGGTTLRAVRTPGHTQGATTWFTTVSDGGRQYTVAFLGGTTPNAGVPLVDNPRHTSVIEDTQRTLRTLKAERVPDIYLVGHPQAMFAGKVERMKAGDRPHPLLNGDAWTKQIADADTDFQKRVADERATRGR